MTPNYREYLKRVAEIVAEPTPESPESSLMTFDEAYREMVRDELSPKTMIELPSWNWFNKATAGIRMNEFTIICGPTGSGKTTLLCNIACVLTSGNIPTFIGAVETGSVDFMRVMTAILQGRENYDRRGKEELLKLREDYGSIVSSRMHVFCRYDSRVPHRNLLADLLYAHETHGTKVAVVDNLNFLLDVKSSRDQITAMDQAVHDFVVFVKKVPMHIFMVMHPRKTDGGRVESEFDIKGSSTAVQEAANVILWNRLKQPEDAPFESRPEFCREMKFVKLRKNGRAWGTRIIFQMDNKSARMREAKIL